MTSDNLDVTSQKSFHWTSIEVADMLGPIKAELLQMTWKHNASNRFWSKIRIATCDKWMTWNQTDYFFYPSSAKHYSIWWITHGKLDFHDCWNISALADLKSLICQLFFNFFFSTTSKKPHIYHGNYFEKNKIMWFLSLWPCFQESVCIYLLQER